MSADGAESTVHRLVEYELSLVPPEQRPEAFKRVIANLSRKFVPDEPYRTIKVVCTGRGSHRPERFGAAKFYVESRKVRFDIKERFIQSGALSLGGGDLEDTSPHLIFRCPQCRAPQGRSQNRELSHARLSEAVAGLVDAGRGDLDISLLPF